MANATVATTHHDGVETDRTELNVVRAIVGAIAGYALFMAVLFVFRLWGGGESWGDDTGRNLKHVLGLFGPRDLNFVGAAGAVLGFVGGLVGMGVYGRRALPRGLVGAGVGYAAIAALTMLVRAAFGMDTYAEFPVFVFGVVGALLGFYWGIGAFSYWYSYAAGHPTPAHEDHSNHGARRGWRDFLIFNTDHKVIGLQYIVATFGFFLIGGALAELVRAELANPQLQYLQDANAYNTTFSMHGVIMLFLFIIPVFSGIANYVLPIMIGAPDMAYPRLNALSFWTFLFGGLLFMASFIVGGFGTGWTNYAPLSSTGGAEHDVGQLFWLMGIQVVGASSIMTALNFVVTIITMRAPGMTMWRMPLLAWANLTTSLLVVFGTPFIAGSQFMVLFDVVMNTDFFKSAQGGDPIAYQHIFWFYSHPAVYIMMLPGFGIISEVITTHARKPLFGYRALALSTVAIGFLGFTVWAHHMFTSGMADWLRLPMMVTTMLIAVPTGIKVLGWSATLWGGRIHLTTGMLFTLGFLFTFTIGGLTGIMLASVPFDIHAQDSYFVVAHFHYVLFGGSVMTVFAGIYHWFPKMTGRMYSEVLGRWHFWLTFVGLNLTFFPMHWVGTLGMNRRVADYELLAQIHPEVHGWNIVITVGALIQGIAVMIFVYNMVHSWRSGPKAPGNPWRSRTLEWLVSSPPPLFNFYDTPQVVAGPYDFGSPGTRHAIVAESPHAVHAGTTHDAHTATTTAHGSEETQG